MKTEKTQINYRMDVRMTFDFFADLQMIDLAVL